MKRSLFLIMILTFFLIVSCETSKKTDKDDSQSGDDSEFVDDELVDDDSSEAKADCIEGDDKIVFCGADNDGLQQMLCVDGAWEKDGDCIMRSSCDEGDTKLISCKDEDDGFQKMVCTDGSWVSDGGCDTPVECETDEEKVVVCGENNEGLQRVICDDGSWVDDGDCMINIECEAGEERVVECGVNGDKFLTLICENGQWKEDGECLDVSCVNGELKEVACGYNYTGVQTKVCQDNAWGDQGGCITGDPLSGEVYVKRKTTKDITNDILQVEEYSYHLVDGHLMPATYKRKLPISWSRGSWLPDLYNRYNINGELVGHTSSVYGEYIYELDDYEDLQVHEIVWGEGGAQDSSLEFDVEEAVFFGNVDSFKVFLQEYDLGKADRPDIFEGSFEISFNPVTLIAKYMNVSGEVSESEEWKNKKAPMHSDMPTRDMEYMKIQQIFPGGAYLNEYDFDNYTVEQHETTPNGFMKHFITLKKGTLFGDVFEKVECTSGGKSGSCFIDDDGIRYDNFTEVWSYDANENQIGLIKTSQHDVNGDGTAETVELEKKIYENGKIKSWWTKKERGFNENAYSPHFIPYTPLELSSGRIIDTNGNIHYEEWTYDVDGFIIKKVGKADSADLDPLYETVWENTFVAGELTRVTYTNNAGDKFHLTFSGVSDGWIDVFLRRDPDDTFISHYSYKTETVAGITTRSYKKYYESGNFIKGIEKKLTSNNRLISLAELYEEGTRKLVTEYDSTDMFDGERVIRRTYYDVDGVTELQRAEYHETRDTAQLFCQGSGCQNPGFSYSSSYFSLNGAVQNFWNEVVTHDAQGFVESRTVIAGANKEMAVKVKEYQYAYSLNHQRLTTKEFLHYPNCRKDEWIWDADASDWIRPEASEYLNETTFDKYGNVVAYTRTIEYGDGEKHVLEELTANANETPATYFCDYRYCNLSGEARECADFNGENNNLSPCNFIKTAWSYDAQEKLTGILHSDRADNVKRETAITWQTVAGKAVHEQFERFYAGDTVEKKTYNAHGDIVENYFNDEYVEFDKLDPPSAEFSHIKYFYDDNNGLLKEEIYGQGEIIINWFDYLNTYSSDIAEGQQLLINAIKIDRMGAVVESYDYQYEAM